MFSSNIFWRPINSDYVDDVFCHVPVWDCFKLVKVYPLFCAGQIPPIFLSPTLLNMDHKWKGLLGAIVRSSGVCGLHPMVRVELRGRHMCPLFVSPPTNKGCAFISTTSAALNLSAKTHATIIFMWVCFYRSSPTALIVSPLPRGHWGLSSTFKS